MDGPINDALAVLACVFIVWIFPFSFLDKVINWDAAVKQASSGWLPGGALLLYPAMAVELLTPPMIVFGFHDGIAAFVLAGYCAVTAIVFHNFWTYPCFWSPDSDGYPHIWDFFKNFGLVGGLIFIMFQSGFIGSLEAGIETATALNADTVVSADTNLPGGQVDVVAVSPAADPTAHVELLQYPTPPGRTALSPPRANDTASVRQVLRVDGLDDTAARLARGGAAFVSPGIVSLKTGGKALGVRDPDGHRIVALA